MPEANHKENNDNISIKNLTADFMSKSPQRKRLLESV